MRYCVLVRFDEVDEEECASVIEKLEQAFGESEVKRRIFIHPDGARADSGELQTTSPFAEK